MGNFLLDSGSWVYIGSAMGEGSTSLENRIRRHFRHQKKIYWHIDHLLNLYVQLKAAVWAESSEAIECLISKQLEENRGFTSGPKGFGASDCKRGCNTHLYHSRNHNNVEDVIMDVFRRLRMIPEVTYNGIIAKCT
ncbi:DUF123 domain-containing protein [Candidatus Thorarchaeota archaeon]|nr:MAG: DUF123 domain-containing protein [Candidatus Thorarchaeota archaeon]